MIVSVHYTHSILIRKPSLRWIIHKPLCIDRKVGLTASNTITSCLRSMPDLDNLLTLKLI